MRLTFAATDEELHERALQAYWTAARKDEKERGASWPILSGDPYSGVRHYGNCRYVVLKNGGGILAAYRVRDDDSMKPLKRWPEELW